MVRVTDEERQIYDETIDKLKGSSERGLPARILRRVDADGPNWTDRQVPEAFR